MLKLRTSGVTGMKKYFNDERDKFFVHRLGMFIHWGVYSVGEWHEQHGYRADIPRDEYAKFADGFNPVDFDPSEWLDMIQENGYDYLCFTTKHIDGFCMFDTEFTDFNITNTPYGKDILKELSDECHKRDFPLMLYYSPIDRNCPLYPAKGRSYENQRKYAKDTPDLEKYIEFMKGQIRELCTKYGKLYGFWWDGGRHMEYHDESFNEMIRELQPGILINNRGFSDGDFRTPERDWYEYVDKDMAFDIPTEACQSIGTESWGYREDEEYYSIRYLMESMDKILAKGGNYLLNAGPMPNGRFPQETVDILGKIGSWYNRIKEAFYNAEPLTGTVENKEILLTAKGNKIFVHMYLYPKSSTVWMKPLAKKPLKARLLNDGRDIDAKVEITPIIFREKEPYLRLSGLPVNEYSGEVMVVELEME
jgi:alpha-L-fucosidase